MRPIILYRGADMEVEELAAAVQYFPTTDSRLDVQPNDLVIGRYSVLPFYADLERDINRVGARLINTFDQHDYIADLRRWEPDLRESQTLSSRLTPKTWHSSEELMNDSSYGGPYVVKGATNSKKHQWNTHMFAKDKLAAMDVMFRLQEDSLISSQPIVFREYVPLNVVGKDILGRPVTEEYRFFVCRGELICGAFYWSAHADVVSGVRTDEVPLAFLGEVISAIGQQATFYTVDVARTAAGQWLVIEINDGQMAGLSLNDPNDFYKRLAEVLHDQ